MQNRKNLILPTVIVITVIGAAFLAGCDKKRDRSRILSIHAGAGLQKPIDAVIATFKQTAAGKNITFELNYAGSAQALTQAQLDDDGDIFLPGDIFYVNQLDKKGLVESITPVGYFVPVILVQKGNPKKIFTLADLFRDDIKVGLGDDRSCQIGKTCKAIFKKNSLPEAGPKNDNVSHSLEVPILGSWVVTGKIDAAIVWDTIGDNTSGKTEMISIPLKDNIISIPAIALLTRSPNKTIAKKFITFITSKAGKAILQKHNLRTQKPSPKMRDKQ